MEGDIGHTAGLVWRHLSERGESSLAKLKQETKLADQILFMAVGWLAREGKVEIMRDGRSVKLRLRDAA
jgi:Winged helix-turn-helix domain (DUF2582)